MNAFKASDLGLVTTLLHKNFSIIEIDRSEKRAQFIFEDSESLQDVVNLYWLDKLMCPAQSLLASHKKAKHLLYDYKK